jgi:hypothetical protein
MALSQAAAVLEKVIGHDTNATTEQDITNPARDRAKYADPSGETMKALVWMGKNKVEVRKCLCLRFVSVTPRKSHAVQTRCQSPASWKTEMSS